MKKVLLLAITLLLTGCSSNELICRKTIITDDGNITRTIYMFNFSNNNLNSVTKNYEIEIKDGLSPAYHYSMNLIMYNLYKTDGVEIKGNYDKEKVFFKIKIDKDQVKEKNAITEIIYEAKTKDRAENKMLMEGYICEGE